MHRRSCILSLLALALVVLGGVAIWIQQQRQETQTLALFHSSVLTQAPCIENVCPGFDEGRALALEHLAHSEFVQGHEQQPNRIGLSFTQAGKEVGDGVIDFIAEGQSTPTLVRYISFRLFDLELETVLNALGEPDQFLFISGCGMGLRVYARLYYFEEGIIVNIDYTTRRPDSQVLEGATPVDAISYVPPGDIQNHIVESVEGLIGPYNVAYDFHPSVATDDILAQIRPWPGISARPTPSADFCPR